MPEGQTVSIQTKTPTPAKGPLRLLPANPRYFTDGSGKALLLVGSHTWNNLQDWGTTNPPPEFDYPGYLQFLRERGLNFFRLWVWEQATWVSCLPDRVWFTPLPYLRTGPGNAIDEAPKFDLHKFNPAYFQRLRDRVTLAGSQGIYVAVMLFNGTSRAGAAWRGHPFNRDNNINGVNGDPNGHGEAKELHSLYDPIITQLQEDYVRHVIDTLGDLDNVLWEISNESHNESQEWQYAIIQFIQAYEVARNKQHPVGMTVTYPGGNNRALFTSPAQWVSPNATRSEPYKDNPPLSKGDKVMISDTDHLWGIGGSQAWVWKSFLRGLNPILMDPYDAILVGLCPIFGHTPTPGGQQWHRDDPRWETIRRGLGQVRWFSERIALVHMSPHNALASSTYCLANPENEYLVYLPSNTSWIEKYLKIRRRQSVRVDLSKTSGMLSAEWFSPELQKRFPDNPIKGGSKSYFRAPIKGDTILYIKSENTIS